MTKLEQAARQALEALDRGLEIQPASRVHKDLREALAEQTPKKFDPNESFRKEEANLARVREFMRSH